MVNMADLVQQIYQGEISPPPVATLIGFTLTAIQPGQAVIEFEATTQHANPMGTLHGGVLCDIADAAMGMAYASTLAAGETFTTLELRIESLKYFLCQPLASAPHQRPRLFPHAQRRAAAPPERPGAGAWRCVAWTGRSG